MFTSAAEQPADPAVRDVWRKPDRTWWVWDGEQWKLIADWRREVMSAAAERMNP